MRGVIVGAKFPPGLNTESAAPLPKIAAPERRNAKKDQEHKHAYQYPLDHLDSLGQVAPLPRFATIAVYGNIIAGRPAKLVLGFLACPTRIIGFIPRTALPEHRRIHLSSQTWHRRASESSEKERMHASQWQFPWLCF
jgi:hypothetical protein